MDINFFRRDSPKGEASKPVDAKLGRLGPALPQVGRVDGSGWLRKSGDDQVSSRQVGIYMTMTCFSGRNTLSHAHEVEAVYMEHLT